MKKRLTMTLLLAAFGAGAQAQSVLAPSSLAQNMPAGALLTLETKDAAGAFDRFAGLATQLAKGIGGEELPGSLLGIQQVLNSSVGKEAVVGVFTVGGAEAGRAQRFEPHVLAVSRVDEFSGEFFGAMLPEKPGAKVGLYTFVRDGKMFVGQSQGLLYASSSKTLLMNYLARLSGKDAPRLGSSVAYSVPTVARGKQEFSFYLNFSATAKLIRSTLAQEIKLPRLFSPIVDAIDTLGQYSAGFSTTGQGLSAQSALLANRGGKDQPLYRILTDSTDFAVQDIIPASAEGVVARACSPEGNTYMGRWLTRLDLFDPLGFLSDSQLASHLERSAQYLGHECAQVTFAGGFKSGLKVNEPLASLAYSANYIRVSDMAAAQAHLPEYVRSVNQAIDGARSGLKTLVGSNLKDIAGGMGGELDAFSQATIGDSLGQVDQLLGGLKLVYAFRGDYLITAYSQQALDTALAETPDTLAQSADFQAASLSTAGSAGWTYLPNPADLSVDEIQQLFADTLASRGMGGLGGLGMSDLLGSDQGSTDEMSDDEMMNDEAAMEATDTEEVADAQVAGDNEMSDADMADDSDMADDEMGDEAGMADDETMADDTEMSDADMSDDSDMADDTAMDDADMADQMGAGESQMMKGIMLSVSNATADLINRYDGQTSQRQVQGSLVVSKSNVLFRW
ncbi:hypothetical protein [Deinococcus sp.]|uniref:hypothetical protein n=1 Tax=Deinococcus sp. TaxID=47478 RepID=UPI003B5A463F